MHLTTNLQPFGYQAFAAVDTNGARLADIQFEADVESGGATIGLLEGGKWIASSASQRRGRFANANSVQPGYHRSITVVIASNNPDGQSRLTVKWLRLSPSEVIELRAGAMARVAIGIEFVVALAVILYAGLREVPKRVRRRAAGCSSAGRSLMQCGSDVRELSRSRRRKLRPAAIGFPRMLLAR